MDLIEKADELTDYVSKNESKKGMPLLSTKNECMGHYLTDLITLAQSQLNGKKVEDSDLINRLIEQRVTMERIRPLEDKMKYRIDKLTALAQVLKIRLKFLISRNFHLKKTKVLIRNRGTRRL